MMAKALFTLTIILSPFTPVFEKSLTKISTVFENQPASIAEQKITSQELRQKWEKWNKYRQTSMSALSAQHIGNPNFLPIRNWDIDEPNTEAAAALIYDSSRDKFLYQKNIDQVLPIASLTKIMTSLVTLDHLSLEETVIISNRAVSSYGTQGGLVEGEQISVRNLLHALLMESSNDAAVALAEAVEQKNGKNFVDLMNWKAKEVIGLKETSFVEPTGYDPANISTAREVSQMLIFSFREPFIWQVLKTPAIDLTSVDGKIKHHWISTDILLNRLPDIAGGKTGYTDKAQGCFAMALKHSNGKAGYLITVVLGSKERFLQTEKLIEWAREAYIW